MDKTKPIFCIGVPGIEALKDALQRIEVVRQQYFVLVYTNPEGWKFELFNGDNISEISLNELKSKLENENS